MSFTISNLIKYIDRKNTISNLTIIAILLSLYPYYETNSMPIYGYNRIKAKR